MGRIILVIFIIMFVNFIKKILESAKAHQQRVKPPDFADDEKSLDAMLTGDSFLNEFKGVPQEDEEDVPVLHAGSKLMTAEINAAARGTPMIIFLCFASMMRISSRLISSSSIAGLCGIAV